MPAAPGFEILKQFFDRPVCQRATAPLRQGVQIAVRVDDGDAWTLCRTKAGMETLPSAPSKPDMTFNVPLGALKDLASNPTEDIGEIGIAILQHMAHSDPDKKISVKVHIGPLDLLLRGYLGVLPLGGAGVMKFLASKGFGGISKIKEGISRMRD